jgi:2-methylisocitrate lyase-like PEP mutase family enzyme
MADQVERAETFKALHVQGDPLIIYNVWDAGSAVAVASVGAKAIATGGHGVAEAHGFEDGEQIPLELVLANAARITNSIDVPFSMDIDSGYGQTPDDVRKTVLRVIETGVVGINIEDKLLGLSEIRSTEEQAERIRAID